MGKWRVARTRHGEEETGPLIAISPEKGNYSRMRERKT
jgi:hypothetical protein